MQYDVAAVRVDLFHSHSKLKSEWKTEIFNKGINNFIGLTSLVIKESRQITHVATRDSLHLLQNTLFSQNYCFMNAVIQWKLHVCVGWLIKHVKVRKF